VVGEQVGGGAGGGVQRQPEPGRVGDLPPAEAVGVAPEPRLRGGLLGVSATMSNASVASGLVRHAYTGRRRVRASSSTSAAWVGSCLASSSSRLTHGRHIRKASSQFPRHT
jgi:hypothetical protein